MKVTKGVAWSPQPAQGARGGDTTDSRRAEPEYPLGPAFLWSAGPGFSCACPGQRARPARVRSARDALLPDVTLRPVATPVRRRFLVRAMANVALDLR
jgi:hypothetical protein